MADIITFRVLNFVGTGPGAGGAVLLPAVAGRNYRIWKIVSSVAGAVIGNLQTAPTVSFPVAVGVMAYDGTPYYTGQTGTAVFWADAGTAENVTVFYTLEGGM
jgi:hypothetical protein